MTSLFDYVTFTFFQKSKFSRNFSSHVTIYSPAAIITNTSRGVPDYKTSELHVNQLKIFFINLSFILELLRNYRKMDDRILYSLLGCSIPPPCPLGPPPDGANLLDDIEHLIEEITRGMF